MLQQRFKQAFLEKRLCPATVTIAEADYESLQQSIWPSTVLLKNQQFFLDSFLKREPISEEHLAEMDIYQHGNITYILNYVNAGYVKLICNPDLPPGTIQLNKDSQK